MLYFPQLATGATVQFPLDRRLTRRTIVNRMPDGSVVKLDDPNAAGLSWSLKYQGLSDLERDAIETLFCEAEGRLRPFVFVDPTGNLLSWSEDLAKAVWHEDGALQATAGVPDPDGMERGSRILNTAQSRQSIAQTIDGTGSLRYCFSVFARSASRTRIELSLSNSAGSIAADQFADGNWRLLSCSGDLSDGAAEVTCRATVEAGTAVDVYGFQLSAQPNSSAYRRTGAESAVYAHSRFLDDELQFIANGIDDHAVSLRIFSRLGS
jgi:hypothetical protein